MSAVEKKYAVFCNTVAERSLVATYDTQEEAEWDAAIFAEQNQYSMEYRSMHQKCYYEVAAVWTAKDGGV